MRTIVLLLLSMVVCLLPTHAQLNTIRAKSYTELMDKAHSIFIGEMEIFQSNLSRLYSKKHFKEVRERLSSDWGEILMVKYDTLYVIDMKNTYNTDIAELVYHNGYFQGVTSHSLSSEILPICDIDLRVSDAVLRWDKTTFYETAKKEMRRVEPSRDSKSIKEQPVRITAYRFIRIDGKWTFEYMHAEQDIESPWKTK